MNTSPASVHRLVCSEIWGGIKDQNLDVASASLKASLFSSACKGGKGGDIYYLSVCGKDNITRLAIADVVGHGESVSTVSQWLYASLKAHMNEPGEAVVLKDLNRLVSGRGLSAMTTIVLAGVYRAQRTIYFVYAGHPPVFIFKKGDLIWRKVTPRISGDGLFNLPLGIDADIDYSAQKVSVSPGDRLFLYSDGVLESKDEKGVFFGEKNLSVVLEEAKEKDASGIKSAVINRLREYTDDTLDHDDITLMAVEIL